jgi:hypothetical protein
VILYVVLTIDLCSAVRSCIISGVDYYSGDDDRDVRACVKDAIGALADMAGEVDRYTQRNDRLCELCKELDELV